MRPLRLRPLVLTAVAAPALAIAGGAGAAAPQEAPARAAADAPRVAHAVRPNRLAASLDVAQETPAPVATTGGKGTFIASLRRVGSRHRLVWRLRYSKLTGDAAAAHIHLGDPGVAGAVLIPLCGGATACRSGMVGRAFVSGTVAAQLRGGKTYVNVHTATNPSGEIRGQIGVRYLVRGVLNVGQERPRPTGTRRGARGLFTGNVVKIGSDIQMSWRLTFRRLSGAAQAAHLHRGRRGVAGPVEVPLCGPCASGVKGTDSISATVLRRILAGRTYVNVHTARNASGEIRGQVRAR